MIDDTSLITDMNTLKAQFDSILIYNDMLAFAMPAI